MVIIPSRPSVSVQIAAEELVFHIGDEHPEWWKDGEPTRSHPHPDYVNEELIAQKTQDALEYFSTGGKYPGAMAAGDYFSVSPNDGRTGLIWSEAGEKMRGEDATGQFSTGWASDFVFHMANKIAG